MSVAVRLSIVGKTHQRSFRVFAQEKRTKRDGKFLEILGSVNPHLPEDKQIVLKKDRIAFWKKQGAQLSPTVEYLVKNGKLPPRPKKERAKKETAPSQPQQPETETPQDESKQAEPTETETEGQAEQAETQVDSKPEEKPQQSGEEAAQTSAQESAESEAKAPPEETPAAQEEKVEPKE